MLKSLRSHLPKPKEGQEKEIPKEYSIIIIGTHSDQFKGDWTEYKKKIEEIYKKMGFNFPILQISVSCHPKKMENIGILFDTILNLSLEHSYMGELIPETLLVIERILTKMREEKEEEKRKEEEKKKEDPTRKAVIPMITIDELKERLKELKKYEFTDDLIRQALSLLHEWGEIVYFSSPSSLSNIIILINSKETGQITKRKVDASELKSLP